MQRGAQAIEIRQQIGDRYGTAMGLGVLGGINSSHGKYDECQTFYEESIGILSDLGVRGALAFCSTWQSFAKMHLGKYEEARVQGETALTFYRDVGFGWGGSQSLYVLGCVALAQDRCAEAQGLLQECVAVSRAMGNRDGLAGPLAWLGHTLWGLGHRRQATRHLSQALRTALEIECHFVLPELLPAVAVSLAQEGIPDAADGALEKTVLVMELYALASRYPQVAESRWFHDVAGKPIAAVAATLPADVVAAAQERGHGRDLWDAATELLDQLGVTSETES